MSRWKKFRYRLEYWLCAALAWAVPKLPRRTVAQLARGLGTLAHALDRRGRAVALANVRAALGERPDAAAIVRESYRQFARTMCDLFWSPALSRENVERYVHLQGLEIFSHLQLRQQGLTVVGVHNGGFEWAGIVAGYFGLNGKLVTEDFKNPALAGVFRRLREISGHQSIPQERSILRLLKLVKRGGITGMLIDLNLRADQPAVIIETFGGLQMCVTYLHAILAQRGDAVLLPVEPELLPDGTCRVRFHPPLETAPDATPQQIAQRCWDFFEPIIRAHPERWMWAYKHWRYRPAGAERAYPFYANESSKFEKLRRTMGPRQRNGPA